MKAFSIYGPPGTGKTTEMLRRVALAGEQYDPKKIAYLSFTKAGANEALKRLGIERSNLICTIHSLMYRLNDISQASVVNISKLRQFGQITGYRFKGTSNDTSEQMEIGDQYLSILNVARNTGTPMEDAYMESERPGDWASFEHFRESYKQWKGSNGYVDFTDMLAMYVRRPVDHGADVIFVDEAQDLSNLQWAVLNKMASYSRVEQITVAGDDDQAIFEWAGANPHGMVEFEEAYDAERTILDQSWRVPGAVHDIATNILHGIDSRVDKVYRPKDEEGAVVRHAGYNAPLPVHGEDCMVLCRSHSVKQEVEKEFINMRIPYESEGGLPGLYSNRTAEAIRAFHMLEGGEEVTPALLEKLGAVATDRTKRDIASGDVHAILKRGFLSSLIIRPEYIDFYRSADLMKKPTIRLGTIHSSKGREADRVILHTGMPPRIVSSMHQNPDAEARVWYVGATRAKHRLDIVEGDDGYPV